MSPTLRRLRRGVRGRLLDRRREFFDARPVRLRKDHHPAHDRRLRDPTEGAIRLEGVDVSRTPPHKRNVNTVFQHYALFLHMTVWDNVAYGPRSKKKNWDRRQEERGRAARGGPVDRFRVAQARAASGGQQQRVALARALVNYPSALLLMNRWARWIPKLRHVMQFELKRIQREVGITFVYVTHDQEEASP